MEQAKSTCRSLNNIDGTVRLHLPQPVYINSKQIEEEQSEEQLTFKPVQTKIVKLRFYTEKQKGRTSELCKIEQMHKTLELTSAAHQEDKTFVWLNRLIWIVYCVCSCRYNSKDNNQYGWVEVTEVINGLFVVLLLASAIRKYDDIRPWMATHIISIMLTIGFYTAMEEPLHTIISIIRPLRLLLIIQTEQVLRCTLKSIFLSLRAITKGLSSLLLVIFFYSAIALQLYKGDVGYRCRMSDVPNFEWDPVDNGLCGSRSCPEGTYCMSAEQFNMKMNELELDNKVLFFGYANFNSIQESLLTMFQLMRVVGWSQITFIHGQYFCREITMAFFMSFVIVCPLIIINVLLSFIFQEYERSTVNRLSPKALTFNHPKPFGLSTVMSFNNKNLGNIQQNSSASKPTVSIVLDKEPLHIVEDCLQKITMSWLKRQISHLLIAVQVILVCYDYAGQEQTSKRNVGIAFFICFMLYGVEIAFVVKWYCEGNEQNKQKKIIDICDFTVFVLLLIDYISKAALHMYIMEEATIYTKIVQSLVCLRIMKIAMENTIDTKLPLLIHAFLETVVELLPIMTVMLITLLLGTAISLQIFHDSMKVLDDYVLPVNKSHFGVSPLLNFDTYLNSFVAFSTIMANENWHMSMYMWMQRNSYGFVFFFILAVLVCQFVLSKLFVATYLNKYIRKIIDMQMIEHHVFDHTPASQRLIIAQQENSIFVFSAESRARSIMVFIVSHPNYQLLNKIVLFSYFVMLACKNNVDFNIDALIIAADCLFIIDMVLNIIVYRFVGSYSYTDNFINLLEMLVNLLVVVTFFTNKLTQIIGGIRALRMFRTTQYVQSLHRLCIAIYISIRHIVRLTLFLSIFLLLAGCMGVKFFKDSTSSCSVAGVDTRVGCAQAGGQWKNELGLGFDHIGQSVFNVFAIMTSQGWIRIFATVARGRGEGLSLTKENLNTLRGIFFLCVFFFGNYIFINIFTGVFIQKVQSVNYAFDKFESSISKLPERQKQWERIKNYIYKMAPEPCTVDSTGLKRFLVQGISSRKYKFSLKLIYIVNGIVFLAFYSNQQSKWQIILSSINLLCYLVACLQYLFEIYTFGKERKHYLVDLIFLAISAPGAILLFIPIQNTNSQSHNSIRDLLLFLRAVQILRMYKVLLLFQGPKLFFKNIWKAVPRVYPFFIMFFLLLFVSSVFATDLFGKIRYGGSLQQTSINFDNCYNSLFSIFKIVTGETWFINAVDTTKKYEKGYECEESSEGHNKCGSMGYIAFFMLVVALISVIVLNLLVATVLSMTAKCMNLEESATERYKLTEMINLWSQYDPNGHGYINYNVFCRLSLAIAVLFGIDHNQFHQMRRKKMFLRILQLPVYENIETQQYCYLFYDVVIGLCRTALLLKESYQFDFLLHQASLTAKSLEHTKNPHRFKLTKHNSGTMACFLPIKKKIVRWRKRSMAMSMSQCAN